MPDVHPKKVVEALFPAGRETVRRCKMAREIIVVDRRMEPSYQRRSRERKAAVDR